MSNVALKGNIGSAPELRYTKTGRPVLKFRFAVNTTHRTPEGRREKHTIWYDALLWNKAALHMVDKLNVGDFIELRGRIEHESFHRKDGSLGVASVLHGSYALILRKKNRRTREPQQLSFAGM